MRIAIYGAGSLGTILGAYIAKAGLDVELISRNAAHVEALQTKGARIVGTHDMCVEVKAYLPQQMHGTYDVILLLTKQLENASVVASLKPFLASDGVLCTMQNGLPEPEIVGILGVDHTMGCAVGWGATLLEPGVAELTSAADTLVFNLGIPDGGDTAKLDVVASILRTMGTVVVERNFMGARWSKLLVNASFSGMATALGCTFGDVSTDRRARRLAQLIIKECIDTAHALGVEIEPIQGKDIVRLFDYHNPFKQWISFILIPFAMKKHAKLKPSMLQDIEKGKPCEIDAINGVVSMQGRIAQVPTPVNDRVVETIHRIEKGELTPSMGNLCLLQDFR
ncbi:MAG: 2-dehydropantoate 2-reductase [Spirochaetae bacterium HGW-Spirochaetae-4]|nr:MAG: 2-dehydropantoate 2-reductase [Spirochaetes bacterium GWC2_52_13]PKL19654.1 MAG: 2-dehydropantoate 2-reductase [Spirochaetae bacterium HGW-Spirochaetae-4]HCS36031.1 2-dehydropantoate 2-reductase [Sphaerochaeta sp.]